MPTSVFESFEIATGLTILYYQFVVDDRGNWDLYGEYRNDLKMTYDTPYLSAIFGDKSGNTYFSDNVSPLIPIFEPGASSAFRMHIGSDSFTALEGATTFALSACSWPDTLLVDDYSGFTFEVDDTNVVAESGRISGYVQLTNTSPVPSQRPKVYVVFTDRAGRVANLEPLRVDGPIDPQRFQRVEVRTAIRPNAAEGYRFLAFEGPNARVYTC
jgi:hypothetical protein